MKFQILVLLFGVYKVCESAKVLGVFPTPSFSHQIVYQPIWRELALRGHEVTVISPNILGENIKNLKEINVNFAYRLIENITSILNKDVHPIIQFMSMHSLFENILIAEISCPEAQKILNDKDTYFDVVLVEFINPLVLAFGARFKAPVVNILSLAISLPVSYAVGNPIHLALTPDYFNYNNLSPTESTVWDRLSSVSYNFIHRFLYYWYLLPETDRNVRKYFGKDMPSIYEIEKNISLVLTNTNQLVNIITPNVPAVIQIAQLNIKPSNPLPTDLKEFLDKSKEGVIYFSLGSNVKSVNLSEEVKYVITQSLSQLPFKVLWKWESDYFPNQPKNVVTRKWLPQQDLLGHPNIKAFVTQGGLQSIDEAIANAVPMVGIPFFVDQPGNIRQLVQLGAAIELDYQTMTIDQLKDAIFDVATNSTYKKIMVKLQKISSDTPMKGLEKAIWWIEYVIRHKGASHLRSPIIDMPFYKYYLLDVMLIILITTFILVFIIYKFSQVVRLSTKRKYKAS